MSENKISSVVDALYTPTPHTRRFTGVINFPHIREVFQGKDNEKFARKAGVLSMYTAALSGYAAVFDICLTPYKEAGVATAVSRLKFWTVPAVAGGLAYTSTVYVASNIRNKNDQLNHFFGGLSCGAVIGKCCKKFKPVVTGSIWGLFIGVLGVFAKDAEILGYDCWKPHGERQGYVNGGPWYHKMDFSVWPESPGYWVRKEEDIPKVLKRGQL